MKNYDSTKPIKLLNNPGQKKSISIDKKENFKNYNLYSQQFGTNKQQKNKNSIEQKRPSTAPQKYKISKNKGGNVFGFTNKNGIKAFPNTYSNGFFAYNKRLPSPMISSQKFGISKKMKFNSNRIPLNGNDLFSIKARKNGFI